MACETDSHLWSFLGSRQPWQLERAPPLLVPGTLQLLTLTPPSRITHLTRIIQVPRSLMFSSPSWSRMSSGFSSPSRSTHVPQIRQDARFVRGSKIKFGGSSERSTRLWWIVHVASCSTPLTLSTTHSDTYLQRLHMGNAPSNTGNGTHEDDAVVESVTLTNSPYQRQHQQQQHASYMTHHRHSSSPHALSTQTSSSSGPKDSIHPSTIPIAPIPVDGAPRRFPYVKEQYMNESPAPSSPLGSDLSYPNALGQTMGDKHFQQRRQQLQQQQQQRSTLAGGGPRRRASSVIGGQSYGQYTDVLNEQVLLATAAHQDKLDHLRLQQQIGEGRASYRNSARISRTFEGVDPLKGLDDPQDGKCQTVVLSLYTLFSSASCFTPLVLDHLH